MKMVSLYSSTVDVVSNGKVCTIAALSQHYRILASKWEGDSCWTLGSGQCNSSCLVLVSRCFPVWHCWRYDRVQNKQPMWCYWLMHQWTDGWIDCIQSSLLKVLFRLRVCPSGVRMIEEGQFFLYGLVDRGLPSHHHIREVFWILLFPKTFRLVQWLYHNCGHAIMVVHLFFGWTYERFLHCHDDIAHIVNVFLEGFWIVCRCSWFWVCWYISSN